jgi:hypothetical protein
VPPADPSAAITKPNGESAASSWPPAASPENISAQVQAIMRRRLPTLESLAVQLERGTPMLLTPAAGGAGGG